MSRLTIACWLTLLALATQGRAWVDWYPPSLFPLCGKGEPIGAGPLPAPPWHGWGATVPGAILAPVPVPAGPHDGPSAAWYGWGSPAPGAVLVPVPPSPPTDGLHHAGSSWHGWGGSAGILVPAHPHHHPPTPAPVGDAKPPASTAEPPLALPGKR
jgi:hypothetical protein